MKNISILIKSLKSLDEISFNFNLSPGVNILCGENGVGKTTLLNVMSKLFDANALRNLFKSEVDENTEIEFCFDGKTTKWKKNKNNTWTNENRDNISFLGFIESSFINGIRFKYTNIFMKNKDASVPKKNLDYLSEEIVQEIGFILKKNKNYFSNIRYYYPVFRKKDRKTGKEEEVKSDNPLFVFEINGKQISTFEMSSGEFILTSLIVHIYTQLNKINIIRGNNKVDNIIIGIVDEIEIGLHPSALNRLIDFLKNLCKKENICLFLSTHSSNSLYGIKKENIFLLSKRKSSSKKNVQVINPCYPAYALRSTKDNCGYDKIIFVEDYLAKKIVERSINKENYGTNNLYKVIPAGGWENVLLMYEFFKNNKIGGSFCEHIVILDGDVEKDFNEKYDKSNYRISFLPIPSLEKYFFIKIVVDNDDELFSKIEGALFNSSTTSLLDEVIYNYKKDNPECAKKDKSGKKLINAIIQNSTDKDKSNVELLLCDIAMSDIFDFNGSVDLNLSNEDILKETLSKFFNRSCVN